jgi:hypothetical protein
MTLPLLTPATAPLTRDFDFVGWVCVAPEGDPHWGSARSAMTDSLHACFGAATPERLDSLARKGWRCVPIGAFAQSAPTGEK